MLRIIVLSLGIFLAGCAVDQPAFEAVDDQTPKSDSAAATQRSRSSPASVELQFGGRKKIEIQETALDRCRIAVSDQLASSDALTACSEAVSADPDNPDAYYNRAYIHYFREDYPRAVVDFSRAIELGLTGAFRAYFNRGAALERQDKFRAACQDYKQALDLNPDWTQARLKVESCAWALE